jgi:hypothetical protein
MILRKKHIIVERTLFHENAHMKIITGMLQIVSLPKLETHMPPMKAYENNCLHISIVGFCIQCHRKVFRPLDFFHMLLHYSLILQQIK